MIVVVATSSSIWLSRTSLAVVSAGTTAVLIGASVPVNGMLRDLPMWTAQGVRYGTAGLLLLGWARLRGTQVVRPTSRDLPALVGLAATGMLGFSFSQLWAQQYADPGFVAAALGFIPLLLGLFAPLLSRRRPSYQVVLGSAVVVTGIVVLSGGGAWHGPGLLLVVVTVACETSFTLFAVGVVTRMGGFSVSIWCCLIAGVAGVGGGIGLGEVAEWRVPDLRELGALLVMTVLVTAVGFCLWYHGLAQLGADRVGVLVGVTPVSGLAVAVAVGAQSLTVAALVGVALVAVGCVLGLHRAEGEPG